MIYADLEYRYSLVLNDLNDNNLSCLDIGGFSTGIYSDIHAKYNLDIKSLNKLSASENNNKPDFIGDGLNLHFKQGYFDYTFLIDVLEHVNRMDRNDLVIEALRVCSKGLYLLFPYFEIENLLLENQIRELFSQHGVSIKSSLLEHYNYGLPEYTSILNLIDILGFKYDYRFVTDRTIFFNMFKHQFTLSKISDRLKYVNSICNKLILNDFNVDESNSYRVLIKVLK